MRSHLYACHLPDDPEPFLVTASGSPEYPEIHSMRQGDYDLDPRQATKAQLEAFREQVGDQMRADEEAALEQERSAIYEEHDANFPGRIAGHTQD